MADRKPFVISGRTGDWEVVMGLEVHAQVASNSKLFSGAAADFGAAPSPPIVLTLDPHWFFSRFQFFDRHYGRTHHNRRISIPPVVLEARRTNPAAANPGSGIHVFNVHGKV